MCIILMPKNIEFNNLFLYCLNGIKLTSHTMKIWEGVLEARFRREVRIDEQQCGFMPRKSRSLVLALSFSVFGGLEKANDRLARGTVVLYKRVSGKEVCEGGAGQ